VYFCALILTILQRNLFWYEQVDQLEPGLRFLPIFYAATIVINLFSVFYDGPPSKCILVIN